MLWLPTPSSALTALIFWVSVSSPGYTSSIQLQAKLSWQSRARVSRLNPQLSAAERTLWCRCPELQTISWSCFYLWNTLRHLFCNTVSSLINSIFYWQVPIRFHSRDSSEERPRAPQLEKSGKWENVCPGVSADRGECTEKHRADLQSLAPRFQGRPRAPVLFPKSTKWSHNRMSNHPKKTCTSSKETIPQVSGLGPLFGVLGPSSQCCSFIFPIPWNIRPNNLGKVTNTDFHSLHQEWLSLALGHSLGSFVL